VGALLLTLDGA
jgi:transposase InsO family protein/ribonuclease HI